MVMPHLYLWGDSAPFVKRDQVFLQEWSFLSGPCRKKLWLCAGRCTFDALLKVVAWMLRQLLLKKYPKADHLGRPLLKPWRAERGGADLRMGGACIAKCGDWAWFKSVLGMRGWMGRRCQYAMLLAV